MALLVALPPVLVALGAASELIAIACAFVFLAQADPLLSIAVVNRPAVAQAVLLEAGVCAWAVVGVAAWAASALSVNTFLVIVGVVASPPVAAAVYCCVALFLV